MKILFYDWSLHIIGGGQKVNCKIMEHLAKKNNVDVLTLYPLNKKTLEGLYKVNLSKINFSYLTDNKKIHSSLMKLFLSKRVSELSKNYDLFFNADGQEAIKPLAKKNIMYCHFFERLWYRSPKNFSDLVKLTFLCLLRKFYGNFSKKYKIYCNSFLTKKWLKKEWDVDAKIIYPFVELPKKVLFKKKNLIITVGRLTSDKNYEFFIELFKKFYDSSKKNYNAIIVGAVNDDSLDYYNELKKLIKDYPIEIKKNLNTEQLSELYSKSKVLISAKGLNIDENKDPTSVENFGMTVVEAMAHSCIPLAVNKGGYKESIVNGKNGFLFENKEEALKKLNLLLDNEELRIKMSKQAIEDSKKFSLEKMQKEIDKLVKEL
ncbi:MAG: glycosyltransferase [Candidatus Pacearchaeota archaeon]|jgi:glycosyltransferase involved in cell wall biosynthesis